MSGWIVSALLIDRCNYNHHMGTTSYAGPQVSVVTAILPTRSDFLPLCSASIEEFKSKLLAERIALEWIVALDGPGDVTLPHWAKVVRLPSRCGPAIARNVALAEACGEWIFPVDADDIVEANCADDLVKAFIDRDSNIGWLATNRVLVGGEKTPHWFGEARDWAPGQLAKNWTSPFPFHPNSVIFRRRSGLEVGGWPAVPTIEDMALVLMLSELVAGASLPFITLQYRAWEGQEVRKASYDQAKTAALGVIEKTVNAFRRAHGRDPVVAPVSAGAPGLQVLQEDQS